MDYQYRLLKAAHMKNIICILAIVFFISGCDSNGFLEKIGLKEKITNEIKIKIKEDIAYINNSDKPYSDEPYSDEPFTGKYVEYYSNGNQRGETNYKDGKKIGLATTWHKNGQKESETNYKDGVLNGLNTWWYKNGRKQYEGNYKDGNVNGLATKWYENGQIKSE